MPPPRHALFIRDDPAVSAVLELAAKFEMKADEGDTREIPGLGWLRAPHSMIAPSCVCSVAVAARYGSQF